MAIYSRIIHTCLLSLCLAASAHAASVTLRWDANAEADLAGYRISYGRTPGASEGTVDVGTATTWTLPNAADRTSYYFRVYAYNRDGEESAASAELAVTSGDTPRPAEFSLSHSRLTFGAVRAGAGLTGVTPGQPIVVTQKGATPERWTVTSSAAWLQVSPASGTGTGLFTAAIASSAALAAGVYEAPIAVTTSQGVRTVAVRLRVYDRGTTGRPFGGFDTPTDGTTDISGAIPVTGWAMDDVSVAKVEIFRDPVPGEAGLIYVGDAAFVAGARPDVERSYAEWPASDRGGWGFLLLSNMLPDVMLATATGGNGAFRLHAYAIDAEGQRVTLGSKKVSVNNRASTKPFGSIDTPTQGGIASGSAFVNFGWAISPNGTIAVDGSTLTVLVDGVPVGHPSYNHYRADIAAAFPGYANSNGAIGYHVLDTTTLANGSHTIAWVATDSLGNTAGLGSRFFTVMNATPAPVTRPGRQALTAAATATPPPARGLSARAIAALPVDDMSVEVARPAEADQAPEVVVPATVGELTVQSPEAEPLQVRLTHAAAGAGGTYEGYLVANGELRALPAGSHLDTDTGTFSWQPSAGFIGTYQLMFVRTQPDGATSRIPVQVRITPRFDVLK